MKAKLWPFLFLLLCVQAYTNIKKLPAQYEATTENIVVEILFVTDMNAAFAAAVKCRQEIGTPVIASTIYD
jgi:2-iminobutanoate/2-iminopropanoate deaminase